MIDLYILTDALEMAGIVDSYKSLIWADRYADIGDCEIYLPATAENIALLQMGRYIVRADDDMVCRIRRVEIDTNTESGNFLIVNGYDCKDFLDQRIVWGVDSCAGSVETFIRKLITDALIDPAITDRKLEDADGNTLLRLGTAAGFTEVTTEQLDFNNVGEKVRDYCKAYKWGYKITLEDGIFEFNLYKGTDRSDEVFFLNNYENLSSTSYVDDCTSLGNGSIVSGEGEGTARVISSFGEASSVDRYERYVDAKSTSRTINYKQLTDTYPGGTVVEHGDIYGYRLSTLDIQIIDDAQLAKLQADYPGGTVVTIDGQDYYRLTNVIIATMLVDRPLDNTNVTLTDLIYSVYLLSEGADSTTEYGERITFEGSVIPDITFVYKEDYFLGDLVTVENEFGISAVARIVEVVEVLDDSAGG